MKTLLVDPYVTRHSFTELARAIDVDEPTVRKAFPAADVILVGHAHHDHLGDVPSIAKRTGARIHGSKTTCLIAMAMGVPEAQCVPFIDGDRFTEGPFDVEVVESGHGTSSFGVPRRALRASDRDAPGSRRVHSCVTEAGRTRRRGRQGA